MNKSGSDTSLLGSGVLLSSDIKKLGIIRENSLERCFKPASYDLRVGDDYINPGAGEQDSSRRPLRGKNIVVEPFGSLIVSTHEVLVIPENVVGKFNIRIKQALRGLFVQMGTQVEPGYHGRLFAVLNNITAEPIELICSDSEDEIHSRERLFTIEFFTTTAPATVEVMEPLLEVGKFVESSLFAKSSISSVVGSVEKCRSDISEIATRLEKQNASVLEDVVDAFSGKLNRLEVERASAEKINEIQGNVASAELAKLKDGYNQAMAKVDAVEKGIKDDRKNLYLGVLWGGVGLMLLSAAIPIIIGYTLNWLSSWPLQDNGETYRLEVQQLQSELDALRDAASITGEIDDLAAQVSTIQASIIALEAEIDYTSTDPNAEGSPSQGEQ